MFTQFNYLQSYMDGFDISVVLLKGTPATLDAPATQTSVLRSVNYPLTAPAGISAAPAAVIVANYIGPSIITKLTWQLCVIVIYRVNVK